MEGGAFPAEVIEALRELEGYPYGNLGKIVAFAAAGRAGAALAEAAEREGGDWGVGAGATCFALTFRLRRRLAAAGLATSWLLADKGAQTGVHCGLLWEWDGAPHLLDPGYSLFRPLRLPEGGLSLAHDLAPNRVVLEDAPGEGVWRLWTGPAGDAGLKRRFDFRRRPATDAEFLAAWRRSYGFPMMDYPVLNLVRDGVQYYLQKRRLLIRGARLHEWRVLDRPGFEAAASGIFGVPDDLTRRALAVILRKRPDFFRR